VSEEFTEANGQQQEKLRDASSLATELLMPSTKPAAICQSLRHTFRQRVYTPAVTVWMFILQVLSADHSCQQSVGRLNAWRVDRGLPRVSTETTSYCRARGRLPETLFERLLAWTAERCQKARDEAWLFQGRVVEMLDGWTVTMADSEENQQEYPQMTKPEARMWVSHCANDRRFLVSDRRDQPHRDRAVQGKANWRDFPVSVDF